MKINTLLLGAFALLTLVGCIDNDPSTYIVDDQGYVHHTMHYLRDTRGKDYFPASLDTKGEKLFVFDPNAHAWAAYDSNGTRLLTGSASGGKDICEEDGKSCRTVSGIFKVYRKRGINCLSGEYPVETTGGAKMPYCMYFFKGFTIHAGYDIKYENESHGCIRVLPSAAKWLNENFINVGTKVLVLEYTNSPQHV